ncbi:ATP-binding cassette domain-containing protein [Emticicia sp. CRIBPO]|uniref:ABC transporter ATP-binding protein n=1 Tax=Emticicia sp. CRIBPO TaxID=2683258 RepID=UPI001411BA1D|nr:ABC transporter ATP-binding protein [Emticicia sp. CRIBPO]NBA86172.1 ATP-binding cassette domain-containing protein [Emticicia sp. CRIBPO]
MIELRNLSYEIGPLSILKNVSLTVGKGSILGLIGESGSGKSSLLKLAAGLNEPSSGEVLLDGQKIDPPSEKLIPGHPEIKIVTQHNSLFPNVTIRENVAYELRFFKKEYTEKRVKKLLQMTGIAHLADRYPREVSGGELQRALIAKSVADEPKVLLLDEPFSNLDRNIKRKINIALQKIIREENIACIFVTHEIADAFGMVDELVVLRKGKIIQKGKVEELYHHPKNFYVANLTGAGNFIKNSRLNKDEESGNLLIRPEDISLSDSGEFEGVIKRNIFLGPFYEVHLEWDGTELFFFSKEKLEEGAILKFDILKSVGLGA